MCSHTIHFYSSSTPIILAFTSYLEVLSYWSEAPHELLLDTLTNDLKL
jgi:hypothetical protein